MNVPAAEGGVLEVLFEHNNWANLRLLAVCEGLDESQLDWTGPGSYGSIRDTLVHLAAAQERYLGTFGVEPAAARVHERDGFPGFDGLRASLERTGEGLLAQARRTRLDRQLETTYRGEPATLSAWVVLLQVINHATEHRTNITSTLAVNGAESPGLDGWEYGVSRAAC